MPAAKFFAMPGPLRSVVYGIPVLPLSAAEETTPQLRRVLGQPVVRRRSDSR